jgi:hypothetical protein
VKKPKSKVVMIVKRTDGGPEQNMKNGSVKLADIGLLRTSGADLLLHSRPAPDNSWLNDVEGCMAVLNLACSTPPVGGRMTSASVGGGPYVRVRVVSDRGHAGRRYYFTSRHFTNGAEGSHLRCWSTRRKYRVLYRYGYCTVILTHRVRSLRAIYSFTDLNRI